jgi:hypothetical protein
VITQQLLHMIGSQKNQSKELRRRTQYYTTIIWKNTYISIEVDQSKFHRSETKKIIDPISLMISLRKFMDDKADQLSYIFFACFKY